MPTYQNSNLKRILNQHIRQTIAQISRYILRAIQPFNTLLTKSIFHR